MQATIMQSPPSRPSFVVPVAAVLWVAALGLGLVGVFWRLTSGHEQAGYGSYIPWGLWVAGYVYFIGLSAGAFLISALVYVAGVKHLERIGKLALFTALITLFMALVTIWLDLGHMERSWEVFVYPQPHIDDGMDDLDVHGLHDPHPGRELVRIAVGPGEDGAGTRRSRRRRPPAHVRQD